MNYYNEISKGYNELHGEEQKRKMQIIKEKLDVKKTDRLLDVGCGTGLSSQFDCEVFGLEPSSELLNQCPLDDDHKKLGKAEDIPYPDNYFDIVISVTALQNFDDIEKGLLEMKRVGKDRFVFTILKNSPKSAVVSELIENHFDLKEKIEEDKDLMFFC